VQTIVANAPFEAPVLEQLSVDYIRHWSRACAAFLQWEQDRIFGAEPANAERNRHREALKALLIAGRALYTLTSDPEFLHSMSREVRGRLGQLENSWEMLNNPISEVEADRILAAVFPDEPRA
jgi:hypothetical protein